MATTLPPPPMFPPPLPPFGGTRRRFPLRSLESSDPAGQHSTRDGHHARVGRVVVGPERGLGLHVHESGIDEGAGTRVRRLHLAKLRLESARSLRGPGRWIRAQAHVGG